MQTLSGEERKAERRGKQDEVKLHAHWYCKSSHLYTHTYIHVYAQMHPKSKCTYLQYIATAQKCAYVCTVHAHTPKVRTVRTVYSQILHTYVHTATYIRILTNTCTCIRGTQHLHDILMYPPPHTHLNQRWTETLEEWLRHQCWGALLEAACYKEGSLSLHRGVLVSQSCNNVLLHAAEGGL